VFYPQFFSLFIQMRTCNHDNLMLINKCSLDDMALVVFLSGPPLRHQREPSPNTRLLWNSNPHNASHPGLTAHTPAPHSHSPYKPHSNRSSVTACDHGAVFPLADDLGLLSHYCLSWLGLPWIVVAAYPSGLLVISLSKSTIRS